MVGPEQSAARGVSVEGECGTPRNDWVCRARGRVTYWPAGSPETLSGLTVGGRPKVMPRLTTVRAEAGSEASIRFRRKANCELGAAGDATQVMTRVSAESLFYQQFGSTYCRSLDGSFADVSYFCGVTEECPVVFLSNGVFDSRGTLPAGGDARASEATSYRVVITACTGSFELQVFNGERIVTVKEKVFGKARVRIEVTGSRDVSEGASAEGFGYSISSVSAPGICGF
jgi:hypothetical protein